MSRIITIAIFSVILMFTTLDNRALSQQLHSEKATKLNQLTIDFLTTHGHSTDLNNNAYLHLIALHLEITGQSSKSNSYQDAKTLYLAFERASISAESGSEQQLEQFELLPSLNQQEIQKLQCPFLSSECLDYLLTNRQQIESLLSQQQTIFKKYLTLSQFDNFQPLHSSVISNINKSFKLIGKLLTIEILYLIADNQHAIAVRQLSQLMAINNKATKQNQMLLTNSFLELVINHTVLIKKLKQMGNTNWQPITSQLQPIETRYISGQHYRNRNLIIDTRKFLKLPHSKPLTIQALETANLKFGQYNCLNKVIEYHQNIAVEIKHKRQLLNTLDSLEQAHQQQKQLPIKPLAKERRDPDCTELTKYRDGYLGIKWALAEQVNIEHTKQLTRLIIESQKKSLEQLMKQQEWQSPFNGKQPFIQAQEICYQGDLEISETCVGL